MTEQEAIDNLMEKTFLLLGTLQDYESRRQGMEGKNLLWLYLTNEAL